MKLACLTFLLMTALSVGADAAPISRNNPYRSFNISGINYGSMQWERAHRQKKPVPSTPSRGLFRRR
ncbi:hypothetical protein [Planctomicrobium sp. SH664]|uniref:hypothetical protein n=1 Tax=Planctomicrobium sp. SH664 TaxID=3448125 RepID=UPI003F5C241D